MTFRDQWRERTTRARDYAELIGIGLSVLCSIGLFVLYEVQGNHLDHVATQLHAEARQLGGQHAQLIEGCNRLQIVRIEENISHQADYRVYRVVLAESQIARIAQPLTQQQQRFENAFLPQLKAAIDAKTWVPRTDCRKAVNTKGASYKPPAPIRFSKQLPPKSAVTLLPGDFR